MPNPVRSAVRLLALAAAATALVACGGDDDKDKTGQVKLSVTDAPVQDVEEVWVQFSGVEFKPEGGAPILESLATAQQINLLEYQNGQAAVLVTDLELPAGRYEWIRLHRRRAERARLVRRGRRRRVRARRPQRWLRSFRHWANPLPLMGGLLGCEMCLGFWAGFAPDSPGVLGAEGWWALAWGGVRGGQGYSRVRGQPRASDGRGQGSGEGAGE